MWRGGWTARSSRGSSPSTGMDEESAHRVARDLAYRLAKQAYRL